MSFEPKSYQDSRLVPTDEPDLLLDDDGVVVCQINYCSRFAIEIEIWHRDQPMCEEHHEIAVQEREAERQLMMREESSE